MAFLDEGVRQEIKNRLAGGTEPVILHVFSQTEDSQGPDDQPCPQCPETVELMEEVAALSEHVTVKVHDRLADAGTFTRYRVAHVPTVIPEANGFTGVRFVGIPHGYEFASFLEILAILLKGEKPAVQDDTAQRLAAIDEPVNLKVFYTPACTHCPRAVQNAMYLARHNKHITAEIIESSQFPDLIHTFQVYAVPRTVINEIAFFDGPGTLEEALAHVESAQTGEGFSEDDEGLHPTGAPEA